MQLITSTHQSQPKLIHLLYVPTVFCNLGCHYCYLGRQTDQQILVKDNDQALNTLNYALDYFLAANVLPFNVSLHGGEVTTLPKNTLEKLFERIKQHYLKNFDVLSANGFNKIDPHIKTNLYNFDKHYELLKDYRVSISGSVDLPLFLHQKYRTTKKNQSTLERTLNNIQLLAQYPHKKKLSATLFSEHFHHSQHVINDIWRIHRECDFDMNQFNFMFGFQSALNDEKFADGSHLDTQAINDQQQVSFYQQLKAEFLGSELEWGFKKHWFDEFTPSYCTNAVNCGERFFLLQSDGNVYSCVRGQGVLPFHYGNIFKHSVSEILAAGKDNIAKTHQRFGFHEDCQSCDYLQWCHSGCAFVKHQQKKAKSYTCALQQAIYRDNPKQYPKAEPVQQQEARKYYALMMHPHQALQDNNHERSQADSPYLYLPNDFNQVKNSLNTLIDQDSILTALYSDQVFYLELNQDRMALGSQLLKDKREIFYISPSDQCYLLMDRHIFSANCHEPITNMLYIQMLRDSSVTYGDDHRTKQEHLYNYQQYFNTLKPVNGADDQWLSLDLMPLLTLNKSLFLEHVKNNCLVTTHFLRQYHYHKQKINGFYHIQAINLPFQNFEFYWCED